MLAELLVPGQLDHTALSDTLKYYGSQLKAHECEALEQEALAAHIKAAVVTSSARGSWASVSHVWRAFVLNYGEALERRHPVQALLRHRSHVGCVRMGPLLTMLRWALLPGLQVECG